MDSDESYSTLEALEDALDESFDDSSFMSSDSEMSEDTYIRRVRNRITRRKLKIILGMMLYIFLSYFIYSNLMKHDIRRYPQERIPLYRI